jgi:hypothetical protein
MARCRHERRFTSVVMRVQGWSVWVDVSQCAACREWLPLGPANDSPPEVAIEVYGARIAAEWRDESYRPGCDRFEYCPQTKSEELCSTCEGHYLAHCITTHSHDTGDET